ncbi:phage gp6-like head-tail connector protein [Peribacillus butanolivorans]|uniref:phage gp6-like head-tail connector protein n=1 Tax=Peribacillus butanolivorans TaxID=421767 RepID=UPI0036C7D022
MHISHSSEDDNLKRLLSFSIVDVQDKCGHFDMEKDERAKELVFERTRYAYNDALEYFDDNFLSQITSLGLSIALKEGDPDEAV